MQRSRFSRFVTRAVAVGTIAGLLALSAPPAMSVAAPPVPTEVSGVTGQGFWDTLGCVACVAGFLIGGATSVAGVAALIAANPEVAVACTATCASALS